MITVSALIATPFNFIVPRVGKVTIFTEFKTSAVSTSLNAKSFDVKTKAISSSIVIVFDSVVGASFTAFTVIVAVFISLLTLVFPPKMKGFVVPPTTPVLLSQALYSKVEVPLKFVFGINLTNESLFNNNALAFRFIFAPVVFEIFAHEPLANLYCQVP